MKRSFMHPGTTPTMFFTGSYSDPKTQATSFFREPAHNLTLSSDVSSTAKQNFILIMLFTDMY